MNAAAIAPIGTRTLGHEFELLERARRGEESALIDVFDAVIYDVYSYAYLETGKVSEAERIADATGAEIAWIVRGGNVTSLADVRDRLLNSAARRVEMYRASEKRNEALSGVRASMRHFFLVGAAMFSMVYAGVNVLG